MTGKSFGPKTSHRDLLSLTAGHNDEEPVWKPSGKAPPYFQRRRERLNKIVAAAKGMKHVPRISKGQHEKVIVLACATAAGNSLPPMFIFKSPSGRIPNGVQEGAPPGTLFTVQKSGWIDKDLYLKWFDELFLKSIPAERPVLLIVDGHKAHVTEDVIKLAAANRVFAFCLPAHASHLL